MFGKHGKKIHAYDDRKLILFLSSAPTCLYLWLKKDTNRLTQTKFLPFLNLSQYLGSIMQISTS